ncbi:protein white-like isoform X3 [Portunus trituberculatus]|uniref:protein white-like isoform X3 n=1 Tax=Portunus trituberculatus TaxID=210409 RepID=UPI001E1CE88D|nr:protein white-like isoform X3 [Portunus trituberculatus]
MINEPMDTVDLKDRGEVDPTAGVTYAWRDLNVYAGGGNIFKKKPKVHILKDVSGVCEGGQMLAIMGASGAGKTTLLNVLTYRTRKLEITGDIHINGRPVDMRTIAGVSAYVQQEDLFTGVFTVEEQLHFNAQLRIGKEVSDAERKRRVAEVMTELGLNKCAKTNIGIPGRIKGISGGEKKRLAFACEMITNPLLLLCDEPTSGLDSFMAQSVVNAMKKMTELGKTVIATIHQPSSEVFAMFDRLLLLAEGRVAFLGTVQEAHRFFTRLEHPCPLNYNPGDHFIYTLAIRGGMEEECRQFVSHACDSFRDGEGMEMRRYIDQAMQPPQGEDGLAKIRLPKSPYRASWFNQFAAMTRRATLEQIRAPVLLTVKLSQSLFFAIVFGLIYLDLDKDIITPTSVANISGVLFVFVTNMSFSNMFPVVTTFSAEMPLFLREHWNGLYRTDVYFLTRNLVELPLFILSPFGFMAIAYYMVGLRPGAEHFFLASFIIIIVANVAVSYGYMISCLAKNYQTALVLSTPLTFPLLLFGGFYMKPGTIPPYLDWLSYLSWFKYSFEAMTINQWIDWGNVTAMNTSVNLEDKVMEKLGFDLDNLWVDIGAMLGLMVGYRIVAFLFLLSKTFR